MIPNHAQVSTQAVVVVLFISPPGLMQYVL